MIRPITNYASVIADTTNHICQDYTNYTWNIKYIGEAKFTLREIIFQPR